MPFVCESKRTWRENGFEYSLTLCKGEKAQVKLSVKIVSRPWQFDLKTRIIKLTCTTYIRQLFCFNVVWPQGWIFREEEKEEGRSGCSRDCRRMKGLHTSSSSSFSPPPFWQKFGKGEEQGGINARRGCQKGERGCVPHSKGGRWRQEISYTTARSSIAKRENIRRSGISLVSTSSKNCGPPPEPQKTLQHGPYSIFPLLEVSLSFSWPLSALLALKSKYPIVDTHTHKTEKERDRNSSRRRKKGGERRRCHTASFSFFWWLVGWLYARPELPERDSTSFENSKMSLVPRMRQSDLSCTLLSLLLNPTPSV